MINTNLHFFVGLCHLGCLSSMVNAVFSRDVYWQESVNTIRIAIHVLRYDTHHNISLDYTRTNVTEKKTKSY